MMKSLLVLATCLFVFTPGVQARIGETIPQCAQRYGEAVTNYPGETVAVGQYIKNEITITVWFVKRPYNPARAAMILYARMPVAAEAVSSTQLKPISEEERTALLETVPGKWTPYKPPEKLAGRPGNIIPVASSPGIMETRRDQVRPVLESALKALFPYPWLSKSEYGEYDIGYADAKTFGFEAMRGIAIVAFDDIALIGKWADERIAERRKREAAPKPSTKGF